MRVPPREDREAGFTLIELAVAMIFFGIVVALGVAPYNRYHKAQQQSGVARRVVALLRNAQTAAVAENATYRVDFTPTSATSYRRDRLTNSWAQTGIVTVTESSVSIEPAQFVIPADGSLSTSCFFYPRGVASATQQGDELVISRTGTTKVYRISVEGLTARVSYE